MIISFINFTRMEPDVFTFLLVFLTYDILRDNVQTKNIVLTVWILDSEYDMVSTSEIFLSLENLYWKLVQGTGLC